MAEMNLYVAVLMTDQTGLKREIYFVIAGKVPMRIQLWTMTKGI